MKILLVDDDRNIRQTLNLSLKASHHNVTATASGEDALRLLKGEDFDFVLTDYRLVGKSGIDVIHASKTAPGAPIVVVMTAFASFENAVTAIKEGAYDYIPKPFTNAQLSHIVQRVESLIALRKENETLRRSAYQSDFFSGQTSPAALRLEEFVRKVSPTDGTVLLVGESGTGKTELAKLIHARSDRAAKPLLTMDCATLREVAHERVLFSDKLEGVNQGTLFINKVEALSSSGQVELLRLLQEKGVEQDGTSELKKLDVRVIAATQDNLEEAVRDGSFREDLYYRLNILECQVVPLRHRREDIPVIIQKMMKEIAPKAMIPPLVMQKLLEYSWPGNLRELRNTLERLVLLSSDRQMGLDDLPESVRQGALKKSSATHEPLRSLEEVEKEQIQRVLLIEHNQEKAAEILGITSVTLWRKRKQYGLP